MCLNNSNMSGEFTVYARHATGYSAVILIIVTKANGVYTYDDFYQALGNMGAVIVTSPNASSVRITFLQDLELRWIFRGF